MFLDRDGTVMVEVDYLADPDRVELIPRAGASLADLQHAGYALVVVTNQSGVARGLLDEEQLAAVHARMTAALRAEGVTLDGVYWCPHHPDHGAPPYRAVCDCRKPLPGLLQRAARELALDLPASWMIGDAERDLVAGEAAGARSVLVRTGKGSRELERLGRAGRTPTHVADALPQAAQLILASR